MMEEIGGRAAVRETASGRVGGKKEIAAEPFASGRRNVKMEIKRFEFPMSVCRAADYSGVNPEEEFVFLARTDEERSLVCRTESVPDNVSERDDGWRMMRIQGVLDFSLIGILSKISSVLAERRIGIFAVSTYNTDYIFVKAENYENALNALAGEGYRIV